ncbi:hypothetical protein J437_LFUL003821 [Ladona fulva]|uniref:CUB domain-containing protein n=1 Tax=Ladona fulva TaxID=123851 RepID=A0A8K0P4T2_LADFU|nr:hypothetical protein J437_LFUL003821 [Ladona fulva]
MAVLRDVSLVGCIRMRDVSGPSFEVIEMGHYIYRGATAVGPCNAFRTIQKIYRLGRSQERVWRNEPMNPLASKPWSEAAVVRYGGAIPGYSGGYGNYHTIQSVNGGRGDSSMEEDDFPQIVHKSANKWRSKSSGLPVLLPPLLYPLPPPAPSPPSPAPILHLGDLIPGTFCSRLFGGCDRRICALQSPNYPGLYPRNLTCYFAVRQHRAPKGQVALIAVAQKRGHLVPIPTAATPKGAPLEQQVTLI